MGLLGGYRPPEDVAVLREEFQALRNGDAERLTRYRTYREENESARDGDPARMSGNGVGATDYGQRRSASTPMRHSIPLPFGQALTVKHAYRIAGRMPDVSVDRREESPQERFRSDTMEKIVWGVIRESKGDVELADAAWDSSQLGSACLSVYFDIAKQMPIVRAIDPANALVVRGLDDPHAFQRFYRFWCVPKATFLAEYRTQTFRDQPVKIEQASTDEVTIVECADRERTVRFTAEDGIGLAEREHGYGFVPYVVIPNIGPSRKIWGWADYEFVRALIQYLPQLLSREADILKMVANGSYTDTGTGQSPESVLSTLRKGGIIPSKREGKLEPVNPPAVPAFADGHRETAMEYLKMLGFAPDAAWGGGSAGSGSDRGLQLQPLLELTAMKQVNWGAGLSRLFGMAFQMIEGKQSGSARYRGIVKKGARSSPFNLLIAPDAPPEQAQNPTYDPNAGDGVASEEFIDVPRDPKQLFDGDYDVSFSWQNRIDPDDPAFVLSELNKFEQGTQSLETTLERLGVQSPEDEMKRIEQEADRFPWLRAGMIALTKAQLSGSGQGEGGGPTTDPGTGLDQGLATMLGKDGAAMNVDGGSQALAGDAGGQLYGGA